MSLDACVTLNRDITSLILYFSFIYMNQMDVYEF